MFRINGKRQIKDFIQVSEDKLAVLFRLGVGIYSLSDGSELTSIFKENSTFEKIFHIENKYVIACSDVYELLIINLNDMSSHQIDIGKKIFSYAYLVRGFLMLGNEEHINKWDVSCLPFKKTDEINGPAYFLTALSESTFASASNYSVQICSYDMKVLKRIETKHEIIDLKALKNDDRFIVKGMSKLLICSSKSGDILHEIYSERAFFGEIFHTPDKVYLVIAGWSNICFYHLNASYVYFEHDLKNEHRSLFKKLKMLKDFKYAHLIDSDRSIEIFS